MSKGEKVGGDIVELDPQGIYFTFSRIRPCYSCGRTIQSTIDQFLRHEITVRDVPLLCVFTDGTNYFSQNNRRLYTYKRLKELGEVDRIPVRLRPLPRTRRMAQKYTPEKCALTATIMGHTAAAVAGAGGSVGQEKVSDLGRSGGDVGCGDDRSEDGAEERDTSGESGEEAERAAKSKSTEEKGEKIPSQLAGRRVTARRGAALDEEESLKKKHGKLARNDPASDHHGRTASLSSNGGVSRPGDAILALPAKPLVPAATKALPFATADTNSSLSPSSAVSVRSHSSSLPSPLSATASSSSSSSSSAWGEVKQENRGKARSVKAGVRQRGRRGGSLSPPLSPRANLQGHSRLPETLHQQQLPREMTTGKKREVARNDVAQRRHQERETVKLGEKAEEQQKLNQGGNQQAATSAKKKAKGKRGGGRQTVCASSALSGVGGSRVGNSLEDELRALGLQSQSYDSD